MLRRLREETAPLGWVPPAALGLVVTGPFDAPREPENTGISVRFSYRLAGLVAITCSGVITVTGVGASLPLVMTRDPVITISSSSTLAEFVCACAVIARPQAPAAASVVFNLLDLIAHPLKTH
jgi:hypothetical protein